MMSPGNDYDFSIWITRGRKSPIHVQVLGPKAH